MSHCVPADGQTLHNLLVIREIDRREARVINLVGTSPMYTFQSRLITLPEYAGIDTAKRTH